MIEPKKIALTMVTTWNETCGIADYAKALVEQLKPLITIKLVELKKSERSKLYFEDIAHQANQGDLIHIQHEYAFFGGLDPWSSKWQHLVDHLKKPTVITAHTWLQPFQGGRSWRRLGRHIKKLAYDGLGWNNHLKFGQFKSAQSIIVHSQAFKHYLNANGFLSETIQYFPQGMPKNQPTGNAQAAITTYQLQGKKILLLFGFLMPSKGHVLALEMMKALPDDVILVIAGDKGQTSSELAYGHQVEKLAASLKGRAIMTGYIPEQNLHDLIDAATLCLFPYTAATSSYALSIALAHRKACVASSLPNFMELNQDQATLAIFKAGDHDELKKVVSDLLNQNEKKIQLEQAADQWVKDHHWGALAQEHIKLYQDVLSRIR